MPTTTKTTSIKRKIETHDALIWHVHKFYRLQRAFINHSQRAARFPQQKVYWLLLFLLHILTANISY